MKLTSCISFSQRSKSCVVYCFKPVASCILSSLIVGYDRKVSPVAIILPWSISRTIKMPQLLLKGNYIGKMTMAWSPESHVTCLAEMTWVAWTWTFSSLSSFSYPIVRDTAVALIQALSNLVPSVLLIDPRVWVYFVHHCISNIQI